MTSLLDVDGRLTGVILALRDPSAPVHRIAEDRAASYSAAPLRFAGAGTISGMATHIPGPARRELYDFSLFEEMERNVAAGQREHRLDELNFVVLDVETTGLRPDAGDRIVSLAAVRVRAGTVRAGETFDALVCPERPIPAASTRFHGITDAMVAAAPTIGEVLPAFLRFVEGAVLVGHEASFDVAFLRRDMERLGLAALTNGHPVLDTRLCPASCTDEGPSTPWRRWPSGWVSRSSGVTLALGDALTTAEILVRLLTLLKKRGLVTLGATLDALTRSRP